MMYILLIDIAIIYQCDHKKVLLNSKCNKELISCNNVFFFMFVITFSNSNNTLKVLSY